MYNNEKDRERFRRIRDAQIKGRDPGPRIKDVDWNPERRKKAYGPLAIPAFARLPPRYQGAIIGAVYGVVAVVACVILLPGIFKILGLLGLLVCIVVGYIIGAVIESNRV